jgi:hypothetical protein
MKLCNLNHQAIVFDETIGSCPVCDINCSLKNAMMALRMSNTTNESYRKQLDQYSNLEKAVDDHIQQEGIQST